VLKIGSKILLKLNFLIKISKIFSIPSWSKLISLDNSIGKVFFLLTKPIFDLISNCGFEIISEFPYCRHLNFQKLMNNPHHQNI